MTRSNLARTSLFLSALCISMAAAASVGAQVRCGQQVQEKTEVVRSPQGFDTTAFFDQTRAVFDGKFKGYALIITDREGRRLGFRREGWAVDPCESGINAIPFTLDTESAIGSVTKLFTTVTVLKTAESDDAYTVPITQFLPNRWKRMAHSYYDTVTIADLLRHKAGFRHSNEGEHIASRLGKGRELSTPLGSRTYSNTSMGIFHFIYAKFERMGVLHVYESRLQGRDDSTYNHVIQNQTSKRFNVGLYRQILVPLGISATCNPTLAKFPAGQSTYPPFHDVAHSYSARNANQGNLLADTTWNCASGGLYMSAKDLAQFMSALSDPTFLTPADRERMINQGPANDLMGFSTSTRAEGGRSFVHTGLRREGGTSHAAVMLFPNGTHAVFVANSPRDGNVINTLADAYNAARR